GEEIAPVDASRSRLRRTAHATAHEPTRLRALVPARLGHDVSSDKLLFVRCYCRAPDVRKISRHSLRAVSAVARALRAGSGKRREAGITGALFSLACLSPQNRRWLKS